MTLKDLDDRLLPELARRAEALLRRIPTGPEPTGPLPVIVRMRRWDDRWTRKGPLATLREVPQLGAVVILALILVGAGTFKARYRPHRTAAPSPTATTTVAPEVGDSGHLGPEIGDSVTAYLAETKRKLVRIGTGQPDAAVVAVVSFARYLTPEEVREVFGPLQISYVFYRAPLPLPQTEVRRAAIAGDVVRDSKAAFARVAASRTAEARELLRVAATIENDPAMKADQERDAALYTREATILRGPCQCVFAVVLRTRVRLLTDLVPVRVVRAIDPGRSAGKVDEYTFSGLLPEEKVTVTGGNQER